MHPNADVARFRLTRRLAGLYQSPYSQSDPDRIPAVRSNALLVYQQPCDGQPPPHWTNSSFSDESHRLQMPALKGLAEFDALRFPRFRVESLCENRMDLRFVQPEFPLGAQMTIMSHKNYVRLEKRTVSFPSQLATEIEYNKAPLTHEVNNFSK
jgi:hypothetical protein